MTNQPVQQNVFKDFYRKLSLYLHPGSLIADIRKGSLDDVINYLRDQRLLSRDLADQLHELRKQRNVNMHEISTDELALLVDNVQAMQNTLRMRFLNVS